jgi:serine phosphatase RsbU (regulator of sigma subunit)
MTKGPEPGRSYRLDRSETIVGKEPTCDIVLSDKTVSKRHARLTRERNEIYLSDLNSLNGTQVNNRRIAGPVKLKNGDTIRICDFTFVCSMPQLEVQDEISDHSSILSYLELTPSRSQSSLQPEEKLRAIQEISRDLLGTIDFKEVLEKILGQLLRIFAQADCVFVLLADEQTGEPVPKALKARHPDAGPLTVSRTIFRQVMAEGRAILSADARTEFSSASIADGKIGTVMAVPLLDQKRTPVGIVQIDTRAHQGRFGPDDLELLLTVAIHISVAVENARLHAIEVEHAELEKECMFANEVQLALLPKRRPKLDGFDFWDHYDPARFVGGDFFDYTPLAHRTGAWAVSVGDVSGKGMPAALLMARFSSEVRLILQMEPDPARVVERLNGEMCAAEIGEKFITFLLIELDPEANEFTLINAGHMGPIIRRASGQVDIIPADAGGPPLAVQSSSTYESVSIPIGHGDIVVLYTDGVIDATNPAGKLFGLDQLAHAIQHAPPRASAVGEAILTAVRAHSAGRAANDDITLVCFGRV